MNSDWKFTNFGKFNLSIFWKEEKPMLYHWLYFHRREIVDWEIDEKYQLVVLEVCEFQIEIKTCSKIEEVLASQSPLQCQKLKIAKPKKVLQVAEYWKVVSYKIISHFSWYKRFSFLRITENLSISPHSA